MVDDDGESFFGGELQWLWWWGLSFDGCGLDFQCWWWQLFLGNFGGENCFGGNFGGDKWGL